MPAAAALVAINVDAADATKNYEPELARDRRRRAPAATALTAQASRRATACSTSCARRLGRAALERADRARAQWPDELRSSTSSQRAVPDDARRGLRHVHRGLLAGRVSSGAGAAAARSTRWAGGRSASRFPQAIGAALGGRRPDGLASPATAASSTRCGELADGRPGEDPADRGDRRRRRLRDAALRPAPGGRRAVRRRPRPAGLRGAGAGVRGHRGDASRAWATTSARRSRGTSRATSPPYWWRAALEPPPTTSPRWYRPID